MEQFPMVLGWWIHDSAFLKTLRTAHYREWLAAGKFKIVN